MGTTLSSIQSNAMLALNRHAGAMARLQEQAATGSRINRVSDDSIGANQVMALQSTQNQLTNYIKNINEVITTLGESSQATTDISSMLNEDIRVLVTKITSGTYNENNRDLVAGQINEILEQIISRVNSKHLDQYIFSGTTTKTMPYQVIKENGKITSVNYVGSQSDLSVRTSGGIETAACKSGDNIFKMNSRSAPEYVGSLGVSQGDGTSSVTGFTWLEVTHDAINGQYELTINGGVDSFVVPDDGTGPANLALTDSRTGEVLYVDTTQPIFEGTTLVATPGTFDIFDTVIAIREICSNSKNLPSGQWQEAIIYAAEVLNDMSVHLLDNSSTTGSRIGFLEGIRDNLEDAKFNAESESSGIEQADIAQIAIDLSRREVLYEMSLSVTGKMLSMNLLDFIR